MSLINGQVAQAQARFLRCLEHQPEGAHMLSALYLRVFTLYLREAEFIPALEQWARDYHLVQEEAPAGWVVQRAAWTLLWWSRGKPTPEEIAARERGRRLLGRLEWYVSAAEGDRMGKARTTGAGLPAWFETYCGMAFRFQVCRERVSDLCAGGSRVDLRGAERNVDRVLEALSLTPRTERRGRPPRIEAACGTSHAQPRWAPFPVEAVTAQRHDHQRVPGFLRNAATSASSDPRTRSRAGSSLAITAGSLRP
jgi:hypothetical protein